MDAYTRSYQQTMLVIIYGEDKNEFVHTITTHIGSSETDILRIINEQARLWWDKKKHEINKKGDKWEIFSASTNAIVDNQSRVCPRFKNLRSQPKIHTNNAAFWFKVIIGPEAAALYWYKGK